jgi:hypothetical protein
MLKYFYLHILLEGDIIIGEIVESICFKEKLPHVRLHVMFFLSAPLCSLLMYVMGWMELLILYILICHKYPMNLSIEIVSDQM